MLWVDEYLHFVLTEMFRRRNELKPKLSLDHLVKERYPRFIDALRDMDDALCMVRFSQEAASRDIAYFDISIDSPICCTPFRWQNYVRAHSYMQQTSQGMAILCIEVQSSSKSICFSEGNVLPVRGVGRTNHLVNASRFHASTS